MNEAHNRLVVAVTLFFLDKVLFSLALLLAKFLTPVELSWWVITSPLWVGVVLFWPLGRLTEEVLFLAEYRRRKRQAKNRTGKIAALAKHCT